MMHSFILGQMKLLRTLDCTMPIDRITGQNQMIKYMKISHCHSRIHKGIHFHTIKPLLFKTAYVSAFSESHYEAQALNCNRKQALSVQTHCYQKGRKGIPVLQVLTF